MRSILFCCLILFLALGACDRRVTTTRTDTEREGPEGLERTTSSSFGLEAADDLKAGRELASERKFADAILLFGNVYRYDHDRERQAAALLEWASAEANLLNPDRDVDSAVARLRLLLDEFPGSAVAFEAEERLRRLEALQE